MKFRVRFKNKGEGYLVHKEAEAVGLRIVDEVRAYLGWEVPLRAFNNEIYDGLVVYGHWIDISEQMARESGLFDNAPDIVVKVPDNWFCSFTVRSIEEKDWSRYGKVGKSVIVGWTIDEEAILETWRGLGFPTHINTGANLV